MHFRRLFPCGNIVLNNILNSHPLFAGYTPFVFTNSNNPFVHGLARGVFLFIVPLVVSQKSVFLRTILFLKANVGILGGEVIQSVLVGHTVYGILQNFFDAGQRIILAAARFDTLLNQILTYAGNAAEFQKFFKYHIHGAKLVRIIFQLTGGFHLSVNDDFLLLLGGISGRCCPAEPSSCAGKHEHIVPHALRYGFPL